MDTIDAAKRLKDEFGVDELAARKAIDQESLEIREAGKRVKAGKRVNYGKSVEEAYTRVADWIKGADEYVVALTWQDIAKFMSTHRPACVWAVMAGKGRAQ